MVQGKNPSLNGKAYCPFHENVNSPALSLYLRGGRWRFRCHSCGKGGDGVTFYAEYHGVSAAEAARELGGETTVPERPRRPEVTSEHRVEEVVDSPSFLDAAWQEAVDRIVTEAETELWKPAGRDALEWLRGRGLADWTIHKFRLGFVGQGFETDPLEVISKDGEPQPIYVARGVVFPWVAPQAWYQTTGKALEGSRWVGVNVRRLKADVYEPITGQAKCLALRGSTRGYGYPWGELLPSQSGPPALILEGETDALLAHQEIGHIVHCLTVGGSNQAPHPSALEALATCSTWLLGFDHDEAGVKAALKWRAMANGKARRVLLPNGKDVGDFVQSGGSLRDWINEELSRVPSQ
jgi:DNA primase